MDCSWPVRSRRRYSLWPRISCWESSRDGCGCRDQLAPKTRWSTENGATPFEAQDTPVRAQGKQKSDTATARAGLSNRVEILRTWGAGLRWTSTTRDRWNPRRLGLSESAPARDHRRQQVLHRAGTTGRIACTTNRSENGNQGPAKNESWRDFVGSQSATGWRTGPLCRVHRHGSDSRAA